VLPKLALFGVEDAVGPPKKRTDFDPIRQVIRNQNIPKNAGLK